MTTDEQLKEKAKAAAEATAKATNDSRSGKGTRVFVGATRGKGSQIISWEAFDQSLPATLPDSLAEAMSLTATDNDEKLLVKYIIEGFNAVSYDAASDPILAYVDLTWSDELQKGFRTVVRNYASNTGLSIEDTVNLVKPGFVAAAAKLAAVPATV